MHAFQCRRVPTQLVANPNELHGITRPSRQKDRMERSLACVITELRGSNRVSDG